ncbi:MAG: DUF2075 domain-containing protein [Candidatus Pacearchaeota archaeon]|nr:DUF2075 domain-containing protein [Candidatus Pacearchaeota archaeon]
MRLYEGTVQEFKKDIVNNSIAEKIADKFREYYKKSANESEFRSWDNSLRVLKDVLEQSKLLKNKIVIEYELPYSAKRIDVILFGVDKGGSDNIIVIELKQWSNNNVKDSENEGNVLVKFGRFKETPHPSLQVEGYYYYLKDFMSVFEETPKISLSACAYCHNYKKGEKEVLYSTKFHKAIEKYPLFSREDINELGKYFKEKLGKGDGLEVFGRFTHSILRPSKRLLDHTRDMIQKQQIFNLIDEQITPYNTIMHKARKLSKLSEKSIIIVKGGPGTGKSVIALEVMGELLRKGKKVYHATGSSAFTNTLRKILGIRSSSLFKFFNSFTNHQENEIEVLICDEAHRIRKTSESRYTPKIQRTETPQIEELIKAAQLLIFFIDEHQIVRPKEIGNIKLIRETAERLGVKENNIFEYELKTQFRCGGSDSYLQWLEDVLEINESKNILLQKEEKMKFNILSDPNELRKIIDEKNKQKKNCARIVTGFCWPWSAPRMDGTLVNDVKIGNFEMPWEKKDEFWKWATDDSGMQQVGTVYTVQGFEFDYIGVIFGKDLVYNKEKESWEAKPENSYDGEVKRNNPELLKHLKNVYRVLLSRAHKGVYVYFMDKDTENYFRNKNC